MSTESEGNRSRRKYSTSLSEQEIRFSTLGSCRRVLARLFQEVAQGKRDEAQARTLTGIVHEVGLILRHEGEVKLKERIEALELALLRAGPDGATLPEPSAPQEAQEEGDVDELGH